MAKRKSTRLATVKKTIAEVFPGPEKVTLVSEMAYYLKHSDVLEALERLNSRPKLMKKQFISGITISLITTVGLVVIFAIVTALLGTVGTHLDGPIGDFSRQTSQDLKQKAEQGGKH